MNITYSNINGNTHQGIRDNNEDYIIFNKDSRFIVLCDGMGGHGHGEVASKAVAESVFEYLNSLQKTDYQRDDLQNALNTAVDKLKEVDTFNDEKAMGTTIVVVVVTNDNLLIGHVGDSRAYLFDENGDKIFRTKDHSKVQEAVDAEILTEEEAFSNPRKNILTRCVMSGKECPEIEVQEVEVGNGYRLMLCSDGVTDALRDSEIQAIISNKNIDDALQAIDSECQAKSHDNYSVIIADFAKEIQAPPPPPPPEAPKPHTEMCENSDCIVIPKRTIPYILIGVVMLLILSFCLGYCSKKCSDTEQQKTEEPQPTNVEQDSIPNSETPQ